MLANSGALFGWLTGICYGITLLNYVLKFINSKYRHIINKNNNIKAICTMFIKIVVKYHKIFGFLTIAFLGMHFGVIYYYYKVINILGLISAILIILEVSLGIYGQIKKNRSGFWFYAHRLVAVLLVVTIALHVL